jgi:hypothetical protein
MHITRSAVSSKIKRLRDEGRALEHERQPRVVRKVRPKPARLFKLKTLPRDVAIADATIPSPAMQPCNLFELDDTRCRWPLEAGMFCGGAVEGRTSYCAWHHRAAKIGGLRWRG